MDHPKFDLGYLQYPKINIINKIELTKKNNLISYYGISLKKNVQIRNQLLNTYVRFEKLNNKILKFLEKFNIPIIENIFKNQKIYRVRLFCEMMPNIYNFLLFKKNKTFFVLKPSKIDYKTIKILANEVKNYFSFKPEKETNFDLKFNVKKFEDASHHMGGLRFDFDKNFL